MKDYIAYECKVCGLIFAIPIEMLNLKQNKNRYLACNYGHKNIKELNEYDSIKECMDNHVYVREGRRMRQIK